MNRDQNMSMQFQGRDKMPEPLQTHPSSSSSNSGYVSLSDAAEGPKAESPTMNTKETIRSTMADFQSWEDNIPVAQPWESKPTFPTHDPSPPLAEKEEDVDIDAQLKVVLVALRDLFRESEGLCKKVFSKYQQERLLKKKNKEGQAEPKRKASIQLGKKKISRILKQEAKWSEKKAGMMQRSLSLDSPLSPPERFKIKTLDLGGGGGGGGPQDVKESKKAN